MSSNTGNKLDDPSMIDDTPNGDYNERSPLLSHETQANDALLSTPNVDTIRVPSITRYRPTNILRALFLVEFLTLLIIWFIGRTSLFLSLDFLLQIRSFIGSSTHSLIDDIVHYHMTKSIFDLVAISTCKFILFIIFLTELETFLIARLYKPDSRSVFLWIRYFYTTVLLLLSIGSLTFAIIKLIFILHQMEFSKLYLSSIYLFLIFSAMEFIGIIIFIPYLARLKLLEQPRSTATKKKVDLKRLFSLAKTERSLLILGTLFLLLSSATQIIQPYYFGKIVDDALTSDTMRSVNTDVLIIFGINCVGALASFFRSWIFELSGQ